jgi:hypothetical protein
MAVFVALSMASAGLVVAEGAGEKRLDEIAEEIQQVQVNVRAKEDVLNLLTGQPLHALPSTVLVIPTGDTTAENLAAISEDLNIMARILDKKLGRRHVLDMFRLDSGGRRGFYHTLFSSDNGPTKAMYVQGYGALFLLNVDFPLAPPAEVKVEKPKEPIDPLWEQTKQEMQSDTHGAYVLGRALTYYHDNKSPTAAPSYDPDKVEDVKANLIKALKHAANIRGLKPDESVVLSVVGARQPLIVKEIVSEKEFRAASNVPSSTPSSSMVMTIRVKKSDIDAFAKDELDYDQFDQKTQVVTYPRVLRKDSNALMYFDAGKLRERF